MGRDEAIEDLYLQLSSLIRRSREISHELHPNLPLMAHTFLTVIDATPVIRASELAERLGLDKSSVSRQLNQLHDAGLLDRVGGRPGRRGDPLSLTPAGRHVLAEDADRVRAQIVSWMKGWNIREVVTFTELIARFNVSVEDSLNIS